MTSPPRPPPPKIIIQLLLSYSLLSSSLKCVLKLLREDSQMTSLESWVSIHVWPLFPFLANEDTKVLWMKLTLPLILWLCLSVGASVSWTLSPSNGMLVPQGHWCCLVDHWVLSAYHLIASPRTCVKWEMCFSLLPNQPVFYTTLKK